MTPLRLYSFLFFILLSLSAFGQGKEAEVPVQYNWRLSHMPLRHLKHEKKHAPHLQHLPFFDDFSRYKGWPDDTLWIDNLVYVNTDFPINPPSLGAATFDGLNDKGQPYAPSANPTDIGQPVDTLTSTWIDLSSYPASDSIYLSFFYEPQGRGEAPEADKGDVLILEFKPDSFKQGTLWNDSDFVEVWRVEGSKSQAFRQVMIPVLKKTDTNFFHGKFQFRFLAIGNASGNFDHWNLDYVYMKNGRNKYDTAYDDVAIYQPPGSILRNYYSMPWHQFAANSSSNLADSIFTYASNNSSSVKNVTIKYKIKNNKDNSIVVPPSAAQSFNLNPAEKKRVGLHLSPLPNLFDTIISLSVWDSAGTSQAGSKANDTSVRTQLFSEYLAYDDGTAEGGYGILGTPNNAFQIALRFSLSKPDSLYGFSIHWNQSGPDVRNTTFDLAVWDDIENGKAPVARISNLHPTYLDTINGFYYYALDKPIYFTDHFYVGTMQTGSFYINIGLDRNYGLFNGGKPNPNLYVDLDQGQLQPATKQSGTPMIHAYVGTKRPHVAGIPLAYHQQNPDAELYPNPNNGSFRIKLPDQGIFSVKLFDMSGRLIHSFSGLRQNVQIDNHELQKGIYLLRIQEDTTGQSIFKKMIVE